MQTIAGRYLIRAHKLLFGFNKCWRDSRTNTYFEFKKYWRHSLTNTFSWFQQILVAFAWHTCWPSGALFFCNLVSAPNLACQVLIVTEWRIFNVFWVENNMKEVVGSVSSKTDFLRLVISQFHNKTHLLWRTGADKGEWLTVMVSIGWILNRRREGIIRDSANLA